MRIAMLGLAAAVLCVGLDRAWCGGGGADASTPAAVADVASAFAGDDADCKRQALRDLLASGLDDAVVLPLLVAEVGDYQAHDDVVLALRARTGLTPPVHEHQSDYPDYPWGDAPLAWQTWLVEWRRDHQSQADIDAALRAAREALAAAQQAERDAARAQR